MRKAITETRLADLRLTTAHCPTPDWAAKYPAGYFSIFAERPASGACINCGEEAHFTWGLQHGEGHCIKCGWPARGYHYVKDAEGNELPRTFYVLQYHPDGLSIRKGAA